MVVIKRGGRNTWRALFLPSSVKNDTLYILQVMTEPGQHRPDGNTSVIVHRLLPCCKGADEVIVIDDP
jgi:hypothetical protein